MDAKISPILDGVTSLEDVKTTLKVIRKKLETDFGYVAPNYYFSLFIGLGLALGTAIGVAMGTPFEKGIVFGPMIGSGIGLIGGMLTGIYLDRQKVSMNLVLEDL